jgi:small subunit ribosomal protein S6
VSDERRTRRYETMIVLRTDLQEAGVKEQAERIRKVLETQGAVVAGVHEWGLRELAYIIQKERRGYYLLAEYTGPAASVAELERTLKLSDVILRFVTIRQDEDAPPAVAPQRDVEPSSPAVEAPPVQEDDDVVAADAEIGDVE